MGEIKVEMVSTRETKNKVVYSAVETGEAVESIYVVKAAMSRPYPDTVTLILKGEFASAE